MIRQATHPKAWAETIHKGWKAPQAAGVIHTDFEKGFIKAEVIGFDDLIETGSIVEARAKGKAASRERTTSCRTATWWSSATVRHFSRNRAALT